MMPVNIKIDEIEIRNVENEDLIHVHSFINQSEEILRVLGRTETISYEDLEQRYYETLINTMEFFCGIYHNNTIVGIIKGRIENKGHSELCILSFILLEKCRGRGVGTSILNALEQHFSYYLSIRKINILMMDDNIRAKNFWLKNGYSIKRVTKGIGREDKIDITILEKEIYSYGCK